jgi:hypothetical protein
MEQKHFQQKQGCLQQQECQQRQKAVVAIAGATETILRTQGTEGCQQQYAIGRRYTTRVGIKKPTQKNPPKKNPKKPT